jgi:hypothetical protein
MPWLFWLTETGPFSRSYGYGFADARSAGPVKYRYKSKVHGHFRFSKEYELP